MNIFIGCSMNDEIGDSFKNSSHKLLNEILKDNDLVFGACKSGVMGIAYNVALKNKRNIIGIKPVIFKDNLDSANFNETMLVDNISEQIDNFIQRSDVLIFLPGGYGTMYEFFSVVERKRSKEFDKPIILYNDNESGYFMHLTEFLSNMKNCGFATSKEESYYSVMTNVGEVKNFINSLNMGK